MKPIHIYIFALPSFPCWIFFSISVFSTFFCFIFLLFYYNFIRFCCSSGELKHVRFSFWIPFRWFLPSFLSSKSILFLTHWTHTRAFTVRSVTWSLRMIIKISGSEASRCQIKTKRSATVHRTYERENVIVLVPVR